MNRKRQSEQSERDAAGFHAPRLAERGKTTRSEKVWSPASSHDAVPTEENKENEGIGGGSRHFPSKQFKK
jgi:hypothetical protein